MKIKLLMFLAIILAAVSLSCEFTFSQEDLSGELGSEAIIKVTIHRDHNNCTMKSMDDYKFEFQNVQLIKETAWKEVSRLTYEKWMIISLSNVGEGYVKIWKVCSKQGYEEGLLPVSVLPRENLIEDIASGKFPFDSPITKVELKSSKTAVISNTEIDRVLAGSSTLRLPYSVQVLKGEMIVLFRDPKEFPVLIAGEGYIYRFDQFL